MRSASGFGLLEGLAVLAVAAIGFAIAVPALSALRGNGRCAAGARHMVATFRKLRSESIALRKHRGMYFDRRAGEWVWSVVEDGNGNGLRTTEIRSGTDRILDGPVRLQDLVTGVRPGFPEGPVRELPPGNGWLDNLDDPVKFGRSDIVSFSPLGRSSSGTLYLTDGDLRLYAVVLFGPGSRIRVWRYRMQDHRWEMR